MDVVDAIRTRSSVRAFLHREVSRQLVQSVLDAARWSPSGGNAQPWQVAVVTGEALRRLGDALVARFRQGEEHSPDFQYYPGGWTEPYRARVTACGAALYGALGVERRDLEARKEAWMRNYRFFGAPVGLVFLMDKELFPGFLVDMGIFMQSVMLAAVDHGLATCPQASVAGYPDTVRGILGLSEDLIVIAGMALGYRDDAAPENNYRTEREPLSSFITFFD